MPVSAPSLPSCLHGVEHTLWVPLVVRARAASWNPWLDPQDQHARDVLTRCGDALSGQVTDAPTALNILWRTHKIKELASAFFGHFAHVQGVNLGAGLSDYFQWLDNGQNRWIDVDLPEVVALRQHETRDVLDDHVARRRRVPHVDAEASRDRCVTGDERLATAGTGDVLAGTIGALLVGGEIFDMFGDEFHVGSPI